MVLCHGERQFGKDTDYSGRGWHRACLLCGAEDIGLSGGPGHQAAAWTQRKGQKHSSMKLCGCESFPFFMSGTNLPAPDR